MKNYLILLVYPVLSMILGCADNPADIAQPNETETLLMSTTWYINHIEYDDPPIFVRHDTLYCQNDTVLAVYPDSTVTYKDRNCVFGQFFDEYLSFEEAWNFVDLDSLAVNRTGIPCEHTFCENGKVRQITNRGSSVYRFFGSWQVSGTKLDLSMVDVYDNNLTPYEYSLLIESTTDSSLSLRPTNQNFSLIFSDQHEY